MRSLRHRWWQRRLRAVVCFVYGHNWRYLTEYEQKVYQPVVLTVPYPIICGRCYEVGTAMSRADYENHQREYGHQ